MSEDQGYKAGGVVWKPGAVGWAESVEVFVPAWFDKSERAVERLTDEMCAAMRVRVSEGSEA